MPAFDDSRMCLVLVIAVAALPAHAQTRAGDEAINRLGHWIEAVRAHAIGEADSHATIAALWTHDDLAQMFPYLEALLQLVEAPTREDVTPSPQVTLARPAPTRADRRLYRLSGVEISRDELERLRVLASRDWVQADPNRLLIRGAMLHTDVAMLTKVRGQAFQPNSADAPTVRKLGQSVGERVIVRAPDADFRGLEYGEVHWDVARTLLDRVRPDPSANAIVRQWYRATLATFARDGAFAEAKPHATKALLLFPRDAHLLLAFGCMQGEMASPGVQEFVAATYLPRGLRMDVQDAGEQLRIAADLFERALAADPTLVETRVRLARVRFDQGKPREALTMLQDVAPGIADEFVSYYAQLVLGDAAAALDQRDVAATAYRRAAVLFPTAQTPRLALSMLGRSAGNGPAAFTALAPLLSLPDDPMKRPDPWWVYHKGEGRSASDLMADLTRAIPPAQ